MFNTHAYGTHAWRIIILSKSILFLWQAVFFSIYQHYNLKFVVDNKYLMDDYFENRRFIYHGIEKFEFKRCCNLDNILNEVKYHAMFT